MAKHTPKAKKVVLSDDAGRAVGVQWAFTNGHVHKVLFTDFNEDMIAAFTAYGISQKLGDKYSGAGDSVDLAENMFLAKLAELKEGIFNAKGGNASGASADLFNAISAVLGVPIENVGATWDSLDKAAQDQLKAMPEVKVKMDELKLARKQKQVAAKPKASLDDLKAMFGTKD